MRAGYKAFGVNITLDEAMEIVAKASTRKDRGMSYEGMLLWVVFSVK